MAFDVIQVDSQLKEELRLEKEALPSSKKRGASWNDFLGEMLVVWRKSKEEKKHE